MEWMFSLQKREQTEAVLASNQRTGQYGLALTRQDAELLLEARSSVLREQRRIEFGGGILPRMIDIFCDSDFMEQSCYVDTLIRLQEIFYQFKNEMNDEITDDELLCLMREMFEFLCFGDLDYLEGTCLSNFAQAVRAGYNEYQFSRGMGEYLRFDEVQRWDHRLYHNALKERLWR